MPTNIFPISQTGNLSKYLRVDTGSRKWKRTFVACVDHQILTPFVKRWQRLPRKRYNPVWPRLVEVVIGDEAIVEMNYSEEESIYNEAVNYALQFAERTLSGLTNDEDLFEAILDKEYNFYYPHIMHEHIKTLSAGVIYNIKDNTTFEEAFTRAEKHFNKKLPRKELMLDYLIRKKVTSAEKFA